MRQYTPLINTNMKNITAVILLLIATSGCSKKEVESPKTGSIYLVSVNVEDGVSYSVTYKKDNVDGQPNFFYPTDSKKNASVVISDYAEYGSSKNITAEITSNDRNKNIEIIIKNDESGKVVFSEKKTGKITALWVADK